MLLLLSLLLLIWLIRFPSFNSLWLILSEYELVVECRVELLLIIVREGAVVVEVVDDDVEEADDVDDEDVA